MLRWSGERTCVIDRNGKEEEYNVNRLTKQYEWDAEHPDTSGIMNEQEENKSRVPLAKKRRLDVRGWMFRGRESTQKKP